jgi:hypothetical protein
LHERIIRGSKKDPLLDFEFIYLPNLQPGLIIYATKDNHVGEVRLLGDFGYWVPYITVETKKTYLRSPKKLLGEFWIQLCKPYKNAPVSLAI